MSIHMAIKSARVHQTRLLLEIGTNPNATDTDSRTPLMLACQIAKQNIGLRIVRMLIDRGATVSSKDKHNRTALSYACMAGKEKIVNLLLEDIEYDVNAQDVEGNTPLMYAAMSGNPVALRSLLNILLKYRLSVDLRNKKGFSAYLLAVKMGHFYCAHILKTEGFASDGIRDSEYFLSDKEWMKKIRKEISQIQLQDKASRLLNTRSAPNREKRPFRPHTSTDYKRLESVVTDSAHHDRRPRAATRLTTRSEPARPLMFNSWINSTEECSRSKCSDTTEAACTLASEIYSEKTESVPALARTQTPDLHAILSQYLDREVYKPVKITTRNCPKVTFANVADICAGKTSQGVRQRKPSKMTTRQNSKKNLLVQ